MATATLEQRETSALIGSDKVEGTNVYRSNGDKIGSIERIMLDKHTGKVAYAVMSFGGFLGIGHEHYPVPWSLLDYNTKLGGYEVNISDQQLKGAPNYAQRQRLGLGGPQARPAGVRLLPRAAVLDVTRRSRREHDPEKWDRFSDKIMLKEPIAPFGFPSGAIFMLGLRGNHGMPHGPISFARPQPDSRRAVLRPRCPRRLSRRGDHRLDHPLARRRRRRGPACSSANISPAGSTTCAATTATPSTSRSTW